MARAHAATQAVRAAVDAAKSTALELVSVDRLAFAKEARNEGWNELVRLTAPPWSWDLVLWRLRGACRALRRWSTQQLSSMPHMVCVGGMAKDSSVAPPVARATASVEALDLSTMQWSGAGCMPALPDPRARPSMSLAADGGDSVMVFCGYNHGVADPMHHLMKTALRWSPGGSEWASLPDLPEERQGAVSVGLPDGRTLVIGGFVEDLDDADDQGHVMASVVARAAGGSEWSALAPMAQARSDAAAVVLPDGKVLVAGGYSTDQDDAALETARAL